MRVVRIRCPLCGRWAWQNHVTVNDSYEPDMAIVEFGGSVSAPDKKRGQKQRGLLKWTRFNEPRLLASVKNALVEKLKILAVSFGYRLVPIESYFSSPSYVESERDWTSQRIESKIVVKSLVI